MTQRVFKSNFVNSGQMIINNPETKDIKVYVAYDLDNATIDAMEIQLEAFVNEMIRIDEIIAKMEAVRTILTVEESK